MIAQKQEGLYTVIWHPIGGQLLLNPSVVLQNILQASEMRKSVFLLMKAQYIVNLTGKEAEKILELTKDGAESLFETSVSCIGASICQIGLRDSQELLLSCVKAVHEAEIPDGALPQIHISGCPSSCGTHQTGEIGFRGAAKSVDGKVQPAFVLYINGCQTQGNESMGKEIGTILQKDIPEFLVTLGKTVALSGQDFHTWRNANPEELERMAANYLIA
mgnify:CR=1 FL=1